MGWFSYNLESQEFSFGNMTPQKLLINSDFGCSVYQMPPASKNSHQLRLDTKAMKLQHVLSFSYLYQSLPYPLGFIFTILKNMHGWEMCFSNDCKQTGCWGVKDSWPFTALLALWCFIQLCLEPQGKTHCKGHPHGLKCRDCLGSKLKRIV